MIIMGKKSDEQVPDNGQPDGGQIVAQGSLGSIESVVEKVKGRNKAKVANAATASKSQSK